MGSTNSTQPTTVTLSRRIAGYAANMLATGLVLLAGLVFGSQTIAWWRVENQQVASVDHVATVVGPSMPISSGWLQFGDSTFDIYCDSFAGDKKAAFDQLRLRCRQAAKSSPLFGNEPSGDESRLVLGLAAKQPIENEPNQWSMYQLTDEIPTVVLVCPGRNSMDPVAGINPRVISLGSAFPKSEEQSSAVPVWTLVVCAKLARSSTDLSIERPMTPPGGRRILAIRDDLGNQLCSWSGAGDVHQWRITFDQWHQMQRWTPSSTWTETQHSSHRRYEHPTKGFADVQFAQLPDGSLTGYWTSFGSGNSNGNHDSIVPHSAAPSTAN